LVTGHPLFGKKGTRIMRLFIEPVEPLLFRTGRPFDAGQDTFAESLFPPTPETLQGAVRATIATYWDSQKNIPGAFDDPKLISLIGDQKGYGRFRITGLALGRYPQTNPAAIERLFPSPAHIMQSGTQLYRLLPRRLDETVITNFPDQGRFYLDVEEAANDLRPLRGWLTEVDLARTLGSGDMTGIETVKKDIICREESRLGIGIQRGTKATEEGYLYQTVMIRMNHRSEQEHTYGFVIDIHLSPLSPHDDLLHDEQIRQELHLPASGWMTIGGEQRTAYFRVLSPPEEHSQVVSKRSLLYMATPAMFDVGWKPSPRFAPLDAPLTAAVNRYESIGGWRLNSSNAGGEQKVMHRCVPAGSVYFFNQPVGCPQALTDYGMEIGYGITYEGEW
jgi:CRISPR-associated protein Cmr3